MSQFIPPAQRAWYDTYAKLGIPTSLPKSDEHTNLIDFFEAQFVHRPDDIAFTLADGKDGISLTLEQFDRLSLALAAHLQRLVHRLDLACDARVAVMLPNLLQHPIATVATLRAGLILVNINPLYTQRELEHQLNDSGASILITHNVQADALACLPNTQVRAVIDTDGAYGFTQDGTVILDDNSDYVRPHPSADDVALLQYTGGTTGLSKGAMLTHHGLLINLYQLDALIGDALDSGNDHILTALPLYHIFAFSVCMLYGLHHGLANLLIANPRDLGGLVTAIIRHRPVLIPAVNTLFNALLASPDFVNMDHSHIKLCVGGGMAILPNTAKRWQEVVGCPITEGCGLSETGTVISVNPPTAGYTQSIGIPLPLTDMILVDEMGNVVHNDKSGEIWVKGPQVMAGYWGRPNGENGDSYMSNGYFKTGDIGVMDDQGYFRIIDRKKDVVNVSGFNVFPSEVESVYTLHPKILECCAVGVPDDHSHEAVKLFVVLRPDGDTDAPDAAALIAWGRERLTAYKIPKHIAFIDQIPKSAVGKILRRQLRSQP